MRGLGVVVLLFHIHGVRGGAESVGAGAGASMLLCLKIVGFGSKERVRAGSIALCS